MRLNTIRKICSELLKSQFFYWFLGKAKQKTMEDNSTAKLNYYYYYS
jgi:hypothetical protein